MILFISMQEQEEREEISLITGRTLPWDVSVCAAACVCVYAGVCVLSICEDVH